MRILKSRPLGAALVSCFILLCVLLADAGLNGAEAVPRSRGIWSPTVTYVVDDIVTSRG
jgi:hypothetical protein